MRPVERTNRLGGGLQQNLAALLCEISFGFRREMHIAHLARAENELLASALEDELRFVFREHVRGAVVLLRQLFLPLHHLAREANDHVVLIGLSVDRDGSECGPFDLHGLILVPGLRTRLSSAQDLGRGQRTTVGQEGALSSQYALLNGSSQEPESNTLTGHSLCGRRGRRRRQGIDRVKESRFMSDLDRLRIWDDSAVRGALAWYLDVAENRRPAKFRIAATVATQLDLAASSEGALWAELDRLTPIFVARWQAIRASAPLPQAAHGPSLLELCRELAYRMLAHCNFCPWNCHVDRVAGAKFGACKLASGSRVSSHFHHTGEELFYRGTQGSGTIFFTSCNMRCAFCQNGDISTDKDNGEETDPRTLAAMAWTLRREGCHNINWVGGEVVIHL